MSEKFYYVRFENHEYQVLAKSRKEAIKKIQQGKGKVIGVYFS